MFQNALLVLTSIPHLVTPQISQLNHHLCVLSHLQLFATL